MDHIVFDIGGGVHVVASLVSIQPPGHIGNDGAGFHLHDHGFTNNDGCAAQLTVNSTYQYICSANILQ